MAIVVVFYLIFSLVLGEELLLGYLTGSQRREGDNEYSRPGLTISGAISLAVHELNESLLKNNSKHSLRFIVAETMGEEAISIRQTAYLWTQNITGYIGPQETCIHEARMAAAFNLPMISYFCTNYETSDKRLFPTFARTRPPDTQISKSVAAVLLAFNWTQVTFLYRNSSDLGTVADTIMSVLDSSGITILATRTWTTSYLHGYTDNPFVQMVAQTYTNTRIYLILGQYDEHLGLLVAMEDIKLFDNVCNNSLYSLPVKETEFYLEGSVQPSMLSHFSKGYSFVRRSRGHLRFSLLTRLLFEDAAVKLKLNSLLSFCGAVCSASEKQLRSSTNMKEGSKLSWWGIVKGNSSTPPPPLLLSRLAQLLIKAARSGRPLIHIMKLWSAVGPHLMHASCHKDPTISKLAVTCIHDVMITLLNENSELEHFHFNEALFKPFENLLCLELCDTDIQDQVVNCICEFVEGSQAEIRSGWRPLFRALGGVSTSNHVNSLLEVFQVFLNTDNPLVFANAAMDFILCLVKHVRGNGTEEELEGSGDCKGVLSFVEKCSHILCLMHSMASCPRFNTARRLMERVQEENFPLIPDNGGALAVWAELLEGLSSVVPLCPIAYQSLILDTLFSILSDTMIKPDENMPERGTLMLKNLISAMVECVTVPVESVARLGCACLRHIVVTSNNVLTIEQWNDVVFGVEKAASSVLTPLITLNAAYSHNSHQYYGDIAHIKVAARKDSTIQRNARLRHLAQQVLLLESQRKDYTMSSSDDEDEDERSYVLLIYEDINSNVTKDCVPLCNLLVALLAHQMLLQTIGTILLQGTQHVIPSLAGVVPNTSENRILLLLPEEVVGRLLSCLELSYNTAVEFDSRPGLKFLLQKVAQLERAANLYRQAGAAWTINLITLFDLCIHNYGISDDASYMKEFLPKLRQSLEQLCDTYVDVLLDKDGMHSAVDNINEKITFIIAQTDELPETRMNSFEKSEEDLNGTEESKTDLTEEDVDMKEEIEIPDKTDVEKRDLANEIEKQKSESICKDREAHMGVWAEMLVSALELLCQLDDTHLKTLLPAVFPTVRSLTAHATHTSLKHQLAKLYDKLAVMYGFTNE